MACFRALFSVSFTTRDGIPAGGPLTSLNSGSPHKICQWSRRDREGIWHSRFKKHIRCRWSSHALFSTLNFIRPTVRMAQDRLFSQFTWLQYPVTENSTPATVRSARIVFKLYCSAVSRVWHCNTSRNAWMLLLVAFLVQMSSKYTVPGAAFV